MMGQRCDGREVQPVVGCTERPWTRLAISRRSLRNAVGALLLCTLTVLLTTAYAAAAKALPVRLRISASGVSGSPTLNVRIKTRARAHCALSIRDRAEHVRMPRVGADKHGLATVSWVVPSHAPSGQWTFAVRCTHGRVVGRAVSRQLVLTLSKGTSGPLVSPSTVVVSSPGPETGRGGAAESCWNGVCFPYVAGGDPGGDPFPPGQCTWYAVGRRPDLIGIVHGNASNWLDSAYGKVPEGQTPVPGAIAVWKANVPPAGAEGHVAYVTSVSGGTITVDDFNYNTGSGWNQFHDHNEPASGVSGYIYGGPAGGGISGGGSTGGSTGGSSGGSTGVFFFKQKTAYEIAFQAKNRDVYSTGPGGQGNLHAGMRAGTSPSINSSGEIAFQANDGNLYTVGPGGVGNLHLGMMAGTSPSISSTGEIAFQANNGDVYSTGPGGQGDLHAGMMAGTSPSINSSGEIAFQANDGNLYTVGPGGVGNLHLGMMAGTSPSISSTGEIAFQANNGDVYSTGPGGQGDLHAGMMAGTSPSINSSGEIAFQANDGNLYTVGPGGVGNLHLGMMAGTSPSITSNRGVAFEANDGNLYTTGPGGQGDLGLGMMHGTSPSVAG